MFYHTKQKPLQDVIERSEGVLAMVTGRGRRENQGTIKTKDVTNELKDAGFTARQAKTGSYVIWRHETLPGHNIILEKKAYLPLSAAIQIRQAIQKVKAKSSSQVVLDVIDIDKISLRQITNQA
jgi:hypothetical protein